VKWIIDLKGNSSKKGKKEKKTKQALAFRRNKYASIYPNCIRIYPQRIFISPDVKASPVWEKEKGESRSYSFLMSFDGWWWRWWWWVARIGITPLTTVGCRCTVSSGDVLYANHQGMYTFLSITP
jgi:hypothetical protein